MINLDCGFVCDVGRQDNSDSSSTWWPPLTSSVPAYRRRTRPTECCDVTHRCTNSNYHICKRVLSFITKCVHSDCYVVKAVARHAILHGHMTSPIGRSALYCGLRLKFDIGRLLDPRFDCCNLVWNNYLSSVSAELLANVSVLNDFLLFSADDISCFITALCTGWLRDSSFGFISSFFFYVCVCIFCVFFSVCICFLFTCTLCTIFIINK